MLNLEKIKNIEEADILKLIDLIPDAIVIVDKDGNVSHVNSQTSTMLGYSASDLIGSPIEILIPKRFRDIHTEHRADYTKSPKKRPMGTNLELLAKHKNGTELPVDIMLSPIETDNGSFVISVIRDISERKRAEEEIVERSKQIEDLVSALTHDLKTPLVAAETSLKYLLEGYFGSLTQEQKQILNLLTQSNDGALRLVKNLLSVFKYKTKSYKLLLEKVQISSLIERGIDTVKLLLKEKEISLKVTPSNFEFLCDQFEIERVIVNLLSNAIKYTEFKGEIELVATKNEDGYVFFSVKDNGCGIAEEDLPNLFERFWQSKRSNSRSNSTGLGLYLSRQIVEAHGGKIWVESTIGKGTKIAFELPELT